MSRAKRRTRTLANAPVNPGRPKETPDVSIQRVVLSLQSRFNPIRWLTPELLSLYLDRFKVGYLRDMALTWDAIEERDDTVALVRPLRMKAVSRFGYQISIVDDLPAAKQAQAELHKQALEFFYGNLTVTSAIDENQLGGVKQLVKQMMDAVGKKYSVHEIVWDPQPDGTMKAQFRWVPLWFFENTTGRLRYLESEGAAEGTPLEDGGWMVTVGDGLMFATSIAFMFKTLPLRDWVTYCERHGMPGFLGKTSAPVGSPQWEAMVTAIGQLASEFAAVMSQSESIEVLDLKGSQANLPYEPLVKRMVSTISAMWRGGDLSTQSSGAHAQGHGSERQKDEAEIILEDDVELINETLHLQVSKWVIAYLFGDDVPLARFSIVLPPEEATAQDLAIDQFLVSSAPEGEGLSWSDSLTRYGRVAAKPGESMLQAPQQPEQIPQGLDNAIVPRGRPSTRQRAATNLIAATMAKLAPAQAETLRAFHTRIANALEQPDPLDATRQVLGDLPATLRQINENPKTIPVLQQAYAVAFLDGRTNPTPKAS